MDPLSIVLSAGALLCSLAALAISLLGADVAETMGLAEAQELPDLKRRTARCLMFLVVSGACFGVASFPMFLWMKTLEPDAQVEPPFWFTIWGVLGLWCACHVLHLLALCLQFTTLLRERHTFTIWQSMLMLWSLITGKSVTLYRRKNRDDYRI